MPGNVPRALPATLAARVDPTAWPVPSVMRLLGALAQIDEVQLRATFNGGIGMTLVVPAQAAGPAVEIARSRGVPAWVIGDVVDAAALDGRRYIEGAGDA